MIQETGRPAHSSFATDSLLDRSPNQEQQQALAAGRELLLECVTLDLGQPSANIWLWFKNGQPIESYPIDQQQQSRNSNNPSTNNAKDSISNDNPISSRDLSATSHLVAENGRRNEPLLDEASWNEQHSKIRLISSGRYLFMPSIQLAQKGNYSCGAVNRFGPGLQQSSSLKRDSYQLNVALAPSFVQPLASRTYWPEVPTDISTTDQLASGRQLELVCHVQCEPICQIEWLRNNEPLDLKRQSESLSSNYVTYTVRQTLMDENSNANLFKSIESRLIIRFQEDGRVQMSREKALERRHLLSDSNYTCQSSSNSMGPAVRSTSKFIVQYAPENVLINSPSDKLSLVEGSNGPRLSCEASGEPKVHYRWLLLKSSNSDFASALARLNHKKRPANSLISQSSSLAAGKEEEAINQVANNAFDFSSSAKGANDAASEQDLIELTGSSATEQQEGGSVSSISTLDISNISLDRRQAGHYICEASNGLGQSRQSVYVNVLYKPTCATLHLHSMDLTIAPPLESLGKSSELQAARNYIRAKPSKATINDEYSIVQENSEDFIDLRKILVLSPLLNRYPHGQLNGELSFKDSIFQTILDDKKAQDNNLATTDNNNFMQLKDKIGLMNMDEKSDINNNQNSLFVDVDKYIRANQSNLDGQININHAGEDSWNKFNMLLLKFLNSYMKQVKDYEKQMIDTSNKLNKDFRINKQNRRSSQADMEKSNRIDRIEEEHDPLKTGTKNLLTFACMAQDGNPLSNLSFDWIFGSTSLPAASSSFREVEPDAHFTSENQNDSIGSAKPLLIYANENYTLQLILVKRLDTRTSLNPFQMSLLTLDVLVEPSHNQTSASRGSRQAVDKNVHNPNRPPTTRNRYEPIPNGLKPNQNVQFAQELDSKPYSLPPTIDLNEQNWQEKIGNLLKCTVTNHIGTSDICHVRVNVAERLKSQNTLSEFANWRMPNLAHKSLLIISILIGCALIIFVTSALLLGPYLKGLKLKRDDSGQRKEENNTGQSTSSQKSSVLGLLGNGDSSLQGSSDDDSSARITHHEQKRLQNRMLDTGDAPISQNIANGYKQHHLMGDVGANYDQPRSVHEQLCHNQQFNERTPDKLDEPFSGYQYRTRMTDSMLQKNQASETLATPIPKVAHSSAGSRLLANLKFKSLSKFKVDRISDLSNFTARVDNSRNLHTKTVSSSETYTTGLDGELSMKIESPTSTDSPSFSSASNLRHSHSGARLRLNQQQINQQEPNYYLFDQNGLDSNRSNHQLMQLNSQHLLTATSASLAPAYSNMGVSVIPDAMDEFIRQREIDTSLEHNNTAAFHRSQSVRNQPYLLNNDLKQFYPQQLSSGPPVYPRTNQPSSLYRQVPKDIRPPVATRSSHRYILPANVATLQYQPSSNRFSMPVYNQSFGNEVSIPTMNHMDTIDSHLNRLTDASALSHYPHQNQQQMSYVNAVNLNSYCQDLYNDTNRIQEQSVEHIYDSNLYATPEQTPLRRAINNNLSQNQALGSERPRVSQLIQTFNSKLPE